MTERTHWVYRAYDTEGRALYVGRTDSPARRWAQHHTDLRSAKWIGHASRWVLRGPYELADAMTVERQLIGFLMPEFNRQHRGDSRRPLLSRHLRDIYDKHPHAAPPASELPSGTYVVFPGGTQEALAAGVRESAIIHAEPGSLA